VAEQFTGLSGKYVPIDETVRSFAEIIEGKHDDVPERAFLMKGSIDEVVEATRGDSDEGEDSGDEESGDDESREGESEAERESGEDSGARAEEEEEN
jgi:hypothetical protein